MYAWTCFSDPKCTVERLTENIDPNTSVDG